MERVGYGISGGLSQSQIERIVEDAFELLERVGVAVEDGEVREDLARHRGLRVEGERVHYARRTVEQFIEQARRQNDEYMYEVEGREPLVRPPFLCLRVWDLEAKRARPANLRDLERAVKLLDGYGAEGVPPVDPQDAPQGLRRAMTARVSYEHSRGIGGHLPATSIDEAEVLCDLGRAAGRSGPHVALQAVHSPLRLDANSLRMLLEMKRAKRTPAGITVGGGAMPLAGAAAPLLMPGFLAQGLAEALAAYGTGKLVNEGVTGYASVFPGTFDMRRMTLSMAAPEAILYWLAIRQLSRRVFGRTPGGDFACTGKDYDAQAAAEKSAAIVTAALSGATTFVNCGMTPSDEVFHFEGAVIDMEILGYAWRMRGGLAWEETPTAAIVEEAIAAGTFLTHPTTMRYREELWAPSLFTRESLGAWEAEGSHGTIERAARVAEERIEGHEYRADAGVIRDLARIMERARIGLRSED